MTDALVFRLTHHCHSLENGSDSYGPKANSKAAEKKAKMATALITI